jgi:hypothetical protein
MLSTCLSFNNWSSSSAGLGGRVGEEEIGEAGRIGETGVKELDTSGEEVYVFCLTGVIEVGFGIILSLIIIYALWNFLDNSVKSFI